MHFCWDYDNSLHQYPLSSCNHFRKARYEQTTIPDLMCEIPLYHRKAEAARGVAPNGA